MKKPVVQGVAQLATDGVIGLSRVVESMHARIQGQILPTPAPDRLGGISGLVYRSIRGGTRAVGVGIDLAMRVLGTEAELLGKQGPRTRRLRAVLNGVLGDHLHASANPLALPMTFHQSGVPIDLDNPAWTDPNPSGALLVVIHGLCMGPAQWRHRGQDHGAVLARTFGFSPLYLEYNSGRHIAENGQQLADALQRLVLAWPVPVTRIVVLAHSMGGLVTRSALAEAARCGLGWKDLVTDALFLGTPHQGAPLEVIGHQVDRQMRRLRYLAPFALVGGIRSAGITDLKRPALSVPEWDPDAPRVPMPWPSHIRAGVIAGTLALPRELPASHWIGDGLVPAGSALGKHDDPALDLGVDPSRQCVLDRCGHFDLLGDLRVQRQLLAWLGETPIR